jgi:hypothetical protein
MNHEDPAVYIMAAALLSGCIGFFGCALMNARTVRNAHKDAWREASAHFRKLYQKGD